MSNRDRASVLPPNVLVVSVQSRIVHLTKTQRTSMNETQRHRMGYANTSVMAIAFPLCDLCGLSEHSERARRRPVSRKDAKDAKKETP